MLKKNKQLLIGFLLGAIVFSVIPTSATVQEYILQKSSHKIVVDGQEIINKDLPMLYMNPGYNYIPVATFREICDKLDTKVEWIEKTNEIRIDTGKNTPDFRAITIRDDRYMGSDFEMIIVDNIEYVALREVYENINSKYVFEVLPDKIISLVHKDKVLIESIPYRIINNKTHVEYTYLTDVILPLVK